MKNWEKDKGTMPTLTKEDKIVCKALSLYARSETYIARDYTNLLFVHFCKPIKSEEDEWWESDNNEVMKPLAIEPRFFKFITWDDEEPWLLADLLKLEVEEDRQGETIHWIPFTFDEDGTLNCPIPENEEEVLVSNGEEIWLDTFINDRYECWLDNTNSELEGLAWAKLPKPHNKEGENENAK